MQLLGDAAAPVATEAGRWLTAVYPNDTWVSGKLRFDSEPQAAVTVNVAGAHDVAGNEQQAGETVATLLVRPQAPALLSHPVAPELNSLTTNQIVLKGTRAVGSAIYINDQLAVAASGSEWQVNRTLAQGNSQLKIEAVNGLGTHSLPVVANFFVDSIAPVVTSMSPVNGSYLAKAPTSALVRLSETGSGIDREKSQVSLSRFGLPVAGTASMTSIALSLFRKPLLPKGSMNSRLRRSIRSA